MISSKNEHVFIHDLSDHTLQIIFVALWASMIVGSKRSIAGNNSEHAPSWGFYFHCSIEETGSPGIIHIVCHQVLHHPLEHGTSSMRKHLVATAQIAKLYQITESEVSELTSLTVDETALPILTRQGSWGITIVSSQRKVVLTSRYIHIDRNDRQNVPNWQLRTLKLLNFFKTRGIATTC